MIFLIKEFYLGHIKALLRLAKCLHELERYQEARKCLDIFKVLISIK